MPYFGNRGVYTTPDIYYYLNDADYKMSYRFSARHSKTLTSVSFYSSRFGVDPPTYRLSLQADNGEGLPSGIALASATFTPTANAQITVTFDSSVAISRSKVYHIVTEYSSGTIDSTHNMARHTTDNTKMWSELCKDDGWINVLWYNGTGWEVQNRNPEVTLIYSDGSGEAVIVGKEPLSTIGGLTWGAQEIDMASYPSVVVKSLSVNISKIAGTDADLTVVLENITDSITVDTLTIAKEDVTGTYGWVSTSLTQVTTLSNGKVYRLILKSPTCTVGGYYWNGTSCIGTMQAYGWGTAACYWKKSTDGGGTWVNTSNRDLLWYFEEISSKQIPSCFAG